MPHRLPRTEASAPITAHTHQCTSRRAAERGWGEREEDGREAHLGGSRGRVMHQKLHLCPYHLRTPGVTSNPRDGGGGPNKWGAETNNNAVASRTGHVRGTGVTCTF